jgi:hypothetical protein
MTTFEFKLRYFFTEMSRELQIFELIGPPVYGEVNNNQIEGKVVQVKQNPKKICVRCLKDVDFQNSNDDCSIKVHTGNYVAEDCVCSGCYSCNCGYCIYIFSLISKCKCPDQNDPEDPNCCNCLVCCGCSLFSLATCCIPTCFFNAEKDKQHWSCCMNKVYKSTGCTLVKHK